MKSIEPTIKAPSARRLSTPQRLGGVVGAGLLLLPLTACTPGENTPSSSLSQTDTPTPGATSSSPKAGPLANTKEYYADRYRLPTNASDSELAQAFVSTLNNMMNEGASATFNQEALAQNGAPAIVAFCEQVADNNVSNESAVLLAERAEENGDVAEWLRNIQDINGVTLYYYFLTSDSGDPADKQPYKRWLELTGVKSINPESNTRTLEIRTYEYENDEDNRIGEIGSEPHKSIEGPGKITVMFVESNGHTQIANVKY